MLILISRLFALLSFAGLASTAPHSGGVPARISTTSAEAIAANWRVLFSILSDSSFASWRPIAVDGADLPASQRMLRSASLLTGPGMTADFEFTPITAGDLRLEIKTMLAGWIIPVTLRVR